MALQEFINNWYKTHNKYANFKLFETIKNDKYLSMELRDFQKFECKTIHQELYNFINNIHELPICPNCKKPLPFINYNNGYKKYCNNSCQMKYEFASGSRNDTKTNANIKLKDRIKDVHLQYSLKEFIDNWYKDHNAHANFQLIAYIKNNEHYITELKSFCKFETDNVEQMIWHFINDISNMCFCKMCSSSLKFQKLSIGYLDFCSKSCKTKFSHINNEFDYKKQGNTFKERYGVNSDGHQDFIEKYQKTSIERYGEPHHMKNNDSLKRWKESFNKKYGGENPMQVDEIRKKLFDDNLKQFGTISPFGNSDIRSKSRQTLYKNYGVYNTVDSPEILKKIINSSKQSKLEKKLVEVLTNNNIKFKQQFIIKNEYGIKPFDFAIFDNNDNLVCLVECDGIFYHGYLSDQDGRFVGYDKDITRTLFIPENVKFIAIIETDFENGVKELFNTLNFDYDAYIQDIFNWCRSIDFPYPKYNEKILLKSYTNLCEYETFKPKSRVGDKIVRHFHPSIYHARVSTLSPFDAWYKDELLIKVIKNRFIYKNNIDPSRVLDGFNISKIAPKVSVFQPSLAKTLIQTYLNEFETIYDPFSGFSGRMLGTTSLNKKYIGRDLNETHIEESKNIARFLNIEQNVDLKCTNILTNSGKFECLFTCPPYSNKETWNDNEIVKSADEWIDECLNRFECEKYLFVVDTTEKYKEYIVDEIHNKSHYGTNTEYVILINQKLIKDS